MEMRPGRGKRTCVSLTCIRFSLSLRGRDADLRNERPDHRAGEKYPTIRNPVPTHRTAGDGEGRRRWRTVEPPLVPSYAHPGGALMRVAGRQRSHCPSVCPMIDETGSQTPGTDDPSEPAAAVGPSPRAGVSLAIPHPCRIRSRPQCRLG